MFAFKPSTSHDVLDPTLSTVIQSFSLGLGPSAYCTWYVTGCTSLLAQLRCTETMSGSAASCTGCATGTLVSSKPVELVTLFWSMPTTMPFSPIVVLVDVTMQR